MVDVPDAVGHTGHNPRPGVFGRTAIALDAGSRVGAALGSAGRAALEGQSLRIGARSLKPPISDSVSRNAALWFMLMHYLTLNGADFVRSAHEDRGQVDWGIFAALAPC
jgi:hypothetical protein